MITWYGIKILDISKELFNQEVFEKRIGFFKNLEKKGTPQSFALYMTHPIAQNRFEGPQFLSGEPQEKQHKII